MTRPSPHPRTVPSDMLRPIINLKLSPDDNIKLYRTIDIGSDDTSPPRKLRRLSKNASFRATIGKRNRVRTFRHIEKMSPHPFDDIPKHAFQLILAKLSPADVFNLRTAGLGLENHDHCERSRAVVKHLKRQLITIMDAQTHHDMNRNFRNFLPKHWISNCPDDYMPAAGESWHAVMAHNRARFNSWPPRTVHLLRLRYFQVSNATEEFARFVATSLSRLYRLSIFDRSKELYADSVGVVPAVWKLPRELRLCTQLRSLELMSIKDHLPEAVLGMHFLEELVISVMRLTSLPEETGEKLPKLRFVSAERCPLTSLPDSLIETVKRNQAKRLDKRSGIVVSPVHFRRSYWVTKLDIIRPPNYLLRHQPGFSSVVYVREDVDFGIFREEFDLYKRE